MHANLPPLGSIIGLIIPLVILEMTLITFALIDLIRRKPEQINGNKLVWTIIIICIATIGPICYFVIGRKEA